VRLSKQHVVVVGGSSGIGFETARLAKQEGAEVTIVGCSKEKLLTAADKLKNIQIAIANVTDQISVNKVFAPMQQIDHVYIAAENFIGEKILEGEIEQYRAVFESRIWGSARVIRSVSSKMPAGGSFTLTGGLSTDEQIVPGYWLAAIVTVAAEQMARALALELAPIRVNVIAPGWTDTPMWDEIFGNNKHEVLKKVTEKIPMKRLATGEEVAQAAIFLMDNNFITGEIIHVDGGHRYV
jgi:NAD(P)-dependent dehydrogenase (short-subunit alcohol dehydrogenase family)